MGFPNNALDQIRQRLSLLDAVRRKVPSLKKKGKGYWACCPFHNEKSPSFQVLEQEQFYHCFGCGAHGDIFTFTMETEGGTFPEVVERLAQQAGVDLPKEQQDPVIAQRRQDGYSCLESAQKFYVKNRRTVMEYLQNRGIKLQTIEEFGIGYAPSSWEETRMHLQSEGFAPDVILETGLTIQSDKGKNDYDRFRDRLMVPIHDLKDRVVAFGGRILGQGEPKYLNSPETPFFHKGQLLYNLNRAKHHIKEQGQVYVVEGYFDAIALWQYGLKTAVAPMGTAMTPEQMQTLWRYHSCPVVCLDGDGAGRRAAQRLAERILPVLLPGLNAKFAWLPEGDDPDSFVRKHGADAFKTIDITSLDDVLWQIVVEDKDQTSGTGRAAIEAEINILMQQVKDETVRRHMQRALKDRLWQRKNSANKAIQGKAGWVPKVGSSPAVQEILALSSFHPIILERYIEEFAEIAPKNADEKNLHTILMQLSLRQGLASGNVRTYLKDCRVEHCAVALYQRLNLATALNRIAISTGQNIDNVALARARDLFSSLKKPMSKVQEEETEPDQAWQKLQQRVRQKVG